MNYQKIYEQLINRAISESDLRIHHKRNGKYYEGHHIIPKCIGGQGRSSDWYHSDSLKRHPNIVGLTAKEHFIAHLLLKEIYKNTKYYHKLVYAAWSLCTLSGNSSQYRYKVSCRQYERIKEEISIIGVSEDTRIKISCKMTGQQKSTSHRKNISDSRKGMQFSESHINNLKKAWKTRSSISYETRDKLSLAAKGREGTNKGKLLSIETKQKISKTQKGRIFSDEHRAKLAGPKSEEHKKNMRKPKKNKRQSCARSEETKQKISIANKGKVRTEAQKQCLRKPKSEEWKRAHSERMKGRIPWNKGLSKSEKNL
jgi:hypothetical protein